LKIALIPARGGSKRIPQKNLRLFAGQPLFTHALRAAQASNVFDEIYVSSDSEAILVAAKDHGATPVQRGPELSSDFAGIEEVVTNFITTVKPKSDADDSLCCILPTNPFVNAEDIARASSLIQRWDYVYAVTASNKPISRALSRAEDGETRIAESKYLDSRTQDLPVTYFDAGQFYFAKHSTWLSPKRILDSKSYAIALDSNCSIDIDNESDWELAEFIYLSAENRKSN